MAQADGGISLKGGLQGESSKTLPKSTRFDPSRNTQGSTQTIQEGSDPDDSDVDPSDTRRGKQQQQASRNRRFTIEPGDISDEFVLTQVEDGPEEPIESIFTKVQNAQEFVASASSHPELWCNAIRNMVTMTIASREQVNEYNDKLFETKERATSYKQQLKEKDQVVVNAQNKEVRIREARNIYRTRNVKQAEEIKELRAENENLKTQLRVLENDHPESDPDPDDSDQEGPPRPQRRHPAQKGVSASASGAQSARLSTPGTTSATGKSNNKYPDVSNFHGNEKDQEEWDSWKNHLKSKFMMSWELFETEVSKILYIRDHCKDTAYDIIKSRADLDSADPYLTASEMINDLEQNFGDFDKEGKADAELQNPKSAMGAKDPKETFDAFHARFTAMISPLNMSEREKCRNLRRLINQRLKYRIVDYPSSTSYRELVSRLRQVDLNTRLADEQTPRGARGGSSSGTRGGRGGSNSYPNTRTSSGPGSNSRGGHRFVPSQAADKMRKEGRCFKCFQTGHMANDANAPCKDQPWKSKPQVEATLAELGVEYQRSPTPSEPPPTYNQQLSEK